MKAPSGGTGNRKGIQPVKTYYNCPKDTVLSDLAEAGITPEKKVI